MEALSHSGASAAPLAESLATQGIFCVDSFLNEQHVQTLRRHATEKWNKIKQTLKKTHNTHTRKINYEQCTQKDGARFDCRISDEPFISLFTSNDPLVSLLTQVLGGDDVEVVAMGLIVAACAATWNSLSSHDYMGDQEYHTDGAAADQADSGCQAALTLFIPLCDVTQVNGPTEFVPGSHLTAQPDKTRAISITCAAGSLIGFDTRLWHRGLQNNTFDDRLVIFALMGRPAWAGDYKALPTLVCGTESLFRNDDDQTTLKCPFLLGGGKADDDNHKRPMIEVIEYLLCSGLTFGALEARAAQIDELRGSLDDIGLSLEYLAAELEPLVQAYVANKGDQAIDVSDLDPEVATRLLVCSGQYAAMRGAERLAAHYYDLASVIVQDLEMVCPAMVVAKIQRCQARGDVLSARDEALEFWRTLHRRSSGSKMDIALLDLCFFTSFEVVDAPEDALDILKALRPLLDTGTQAFH